MWLYTEKGFGNNCQTLCLLHGLYMSKIFSYQLTDVKLSVDIHSFQIWIIVALDHA